MLDLDSTIKKFIDLLKTFTGNQPSFKIDFEKKGILITDSCSGLLKLLYSDDRACAHLTKKGIFLQYFK